MNPPSWARPGVKVVCVKKGMWTYEGEDHGVKYPRYGDILTIREIEHVYGEVYLRFTEVVNPKKEYGDGVMEARFFIDRFRPLVTRTQEQDVALFVHHLNGVEENA